MAGRLTSGPLAGGRLSLISIMTWIVASGLAPRGLRRITFSKSVPGVGKVVASSLLIELPVECLGATGTALYMKAVPFDFD